MTITEPILLPADVVVVPVDELPEETREQLEHKPGDYALTRPHTRMTSSIVDESTAGLLERFRAPTTIVDAVIDYSRSEGLDAGDTLERAFPMLAGFPEHRDARSGRLAARRPDRRDNREGSAPRSVSPCWSRST